MTHTTGRAATLRLASPRLARARRWSRLRRLNRDPHLAFGTGLAAIALLVALSSPQAHPWTTVAMTAVFLGVQAAAGAVALSRRPMTPGGWAFLRLTLPLLFVWGVVETTGGITHPLVALYVPVVVAAAIIGTQQAVVLGLAAVVIFLAPELVRPDVNADVVLRGMTLAGVSALLAMAARRLVEQSEQSNRRFRAAAVAERRRSRQITGLEEVNRLLITGGATPELVDRVAGFLVERFGYAMAVIFVAEEGELRLAAQRGYGPQVETIDPSRGVIGRAVRSGQMQLVQDVQGDPDYVSGDPAVVSEIAAPLLLDGVLLGVLNVESTGPRPLDRVDRDLVATIAGRVSGALALAHDRQVLAEQAAHDALTGLHNRRYFDAAFARLLGARRATPPSERRSVAAVMFDLDQFGQVNKQHGVQVGDQALRAFAQVLRDRLRQSDLVARYGGEEFVVILDGAELEHARGVADEIRRMYAARTVSTEDGTPFWVTVSAGCAVLGDDDITGTDLLRTADVALSMAKRAGRNRVVAA